MIVNISLNVRRGLTVSIYGGEYARNGVHLELYVPAEHGLDGDLEWDLNGAHAAVPILAAALPSDRGF